MFNNLNLKNDRIQIYFFLKIQLNIKDVKHFVRKGNAWIFIFLWAIYFSGHLTVINKLKTTIHLIAFYTRTIWDFSFIYCM